MTCFIGIDIGGTYLKAARLWPDSNEISDVTSVPTPSVLPGIIEAVKKEIDFLGKGAAGILITGQMGSKVSNGKFYSWKTRPSDGEEFLDYVAKEICGERCWYFGSHFTLASMGDPDVIHVGDYGLVKFYLPVGDHQCSLLGAGLQPHELSVNLGTGGQVSILGGADRPYFHGTGLTCKTHLPAGRSLASLKHLLNREWDFLEAAAVGGTSELQCNYVTYPGPCGEAGRFDNVREASMTPGCFYRAALESIARNVEYCTVGMPCFDAIRFSGGMFARSELLRDLVAARFPGKQIHWNSKRAGVESLYGLMELAKEV